MSSRSVSMHEQQVLPLTFTNELVEGRETFSSFIIFSTWCQIVFTASHNFGPTERYTIITLWSCRKVNTNLWCLWGIPPGLFIAISASKHSHRKANIWVCNQDAKGWSLLLCSGHVHLRQHFVVKFSFICKIIIRK